MSEASSVIDEELAQQLVDRAKAEGIKLTGPGGLLGDLTRRVLEAGLEEPVRLFARGAREREGDLAGISRLVEGV